jgi:D-alanyl-lipoteichoic acid acyltransferase DltB (MBOAT superfamily)
MIERNRVLKKRFLIISITLNVLILGVYKYADFFINNINHFIDEDVSFFNLILPLAISFFTFQQIAYLADAYNGQSKKYTLTDYFLFVTFFPQLIAGPIVHHKEMMPQFSNLENKYVNLKNISQGIAIFSIGLFKKIVIADFFGQYADLGYSNVHALNGLGAWSTTLAYTVQLYYDFSGYCDMAIGAALLFNIRLPINFNSPYKAVNIQDFWRRWHMTLSNWLRDYIYIPLGGNRRGEVVIYRNLLLTFLFGGFWHGAGWGFIVWGGLHGLALALHRLWQKFDIKLPNVIAWFITILFVHITWVFFRAQDVNTAVVIITKMLHLPLEEMSFIKLGQSYYLQGVKQINGLFIAMIGLAVILISATTQNSIQYSGQIEQQPLKLALLTGFSMLIGIIFIVGSSSQSFLYFNF